MKRTFLISILFFISLSIQAQVRHIKGQKGIEANFGITRYSKYVQGGFSSYFGPRLYGKISGGSEFGEFKSLKFSSYFLDVTGNYTLFDLNKSLFFNGSGGVVTNMDYLNGFEGLEKKSYINYGLVLGGEIEGFLSDKFVILLNAKQRIMLSKNYNNSLYMGLGLKYIL